MEAFQRKGIRFMGPNGSICVDWMRVANLITEPKWLFRAPDEHDCNIISSFHYYGCDHTQRVAAINKMGSLETVKACCQKCVVEVSGVSRAMHDISEISDLHFSLLDMFSTNCQGSEQNSGGLLGQKRHVTPWWFAHRGLRRKITRCYRGQK